MCAFAFLCLYSLCVCNFTNLSSSRGSRPCSLWVMAEYSGRSGMCHPEEESFGPVTCGERTWLREGNMMTQIMFLCDFNLVSVSYAMTKENTYVYQSFWWWIIEWVIPLPARSFADLLNRNSWSFCFTSVLATAPVRPKEGTKGIGVTLGLWLMIYYYLENIPNLT